MKNIVYLLLWFSLLMAGCEQNKIDTWEDDGRIGLYFVVPENGENESDPVECVGVPEYSLTLWQEFCMELFGADQMENAVNFYRSLVMEDSGGRPAYYFGDTGDQTIDTVELVVGYTGMLQTEGFIYSLQSWPEDADDQVCPFAYVRDSQTPSDVPKDAAYFEGGAVNDTVRLIMKPDTYGDFYFTVGFDSTEVQYAGAEECNRWHLSVYNSYDADYGTEESWPEAWLGEFSESKHAFMQTTIHLRFNQFFINGFSVCSAADIKRYIWEPLTDALAAYNSEHPEAPLDFTFPAEEDLPNS